MLSIGDEVNQRFSSLSEKSVVSTEELVKIRQNWTLATNSVDWLGTFLKLAIASFSIDDGDGSENVTFKMNSPFFKLCRTHSNFLKMSNVGEFPWS